MVVLLQRNWDWSLVVVNVIRLKVYWSVVSVYKVWWEWERIVGDAAINRSVQDGMECRQHIGGVKERAMSTFRASCVASFYSLTLAGSENNVGHWGRLPALHSSHVNQTASDQYPPLIHTQWTHHHTPRTRAL